MTREAEIQARVDAATPGPWKRDDGPEGQWDLVILGETPSGYAYTFEPSHDIRQSQTDAEFIAHAREDIPWLLEKLARLDAAKRDPRRPCPSCGRNDWTYLVGFSGFTYCSICARARRA